jgi:hypothetical protein
MFKHLSPQSGGQSGNILPVTARSGSSQPQDGPGENPEFTNTCTLGRAHHTIGR